MTPNPASPVPLYAHVRNALRADIRSGKYPSLGKVPSEAELSRSFAVSRITVRHALGELQNEGLIFRVQGKGAFVTQSRASQDITVMEGFDEAMSKHGHVTFNEVMSLEFLTADVVVATHLRMPRGSAVCCLRRRRFLDNVPLSLDVSFYPNEIGRELACKDLAHRDIYHILENDLGVRLGNARVSIEAEKADDALAECLLVPTQSSILHVERDSFTDEAEPIIYEHVYYRADRFRYELSIHRASRGKGGRPKPAPMKQIVKSPKS